MQECIHKKVSSWINIMSYKLISKWKKIRTRIEDSGRGRNADIADFYTDFNLTTLIFDSTSRNDFQ